MKLALLLASVALLGSAAAQGEGKDSFTLVGHFDGRSSFWTLEHESVRNPDLIVPPNATIHVRLLNEGAQVHNFQVEGQPASRYVSADEPEANHTFLAPASGALDYWCQPHKAAGMTGRVIVAGTPIEPRETPGVALGLLVAIALLAAFARR